MAFEEARFDDFKSCGLTLIEGPNGSGKTTIPWDAISFCFFDKTVRKAKKDQIVNRDIGKDCLVEVGFDLNGKRCRAVRTRKHSEFGNSFIYHIDDKKIELGTSEATSKHFLEDFLKMDFELFRCSVIFAQEETFNFAGATDKEQKDILSKVKNIDFSERQESISLLSMGLHNKRSELLRSVDMSNVKIESLDDGLEEKSIEFDIDKKKRLRSIKETFKTLKVEFEELRSKVENTEEIEDKLSSLEGVKTGLLEEKGEFVENRTKVEYKIKDLLDKNKKRESLGATCDECEQDIDESYIKSLVEKDSKVKDKLSKLLKTVYAGLERVSEKIESTREEMNDLKESLTDQKILAKDLQRIKGKLKSEGEKYSETLKQENPYKERIEFNKKKKEDLEKDMELKEKKIKKVDHTMPYYLFWEKAFSNKGIKSFLLDSMCGTLTNKSNYYLNILTDGKLMIAFDTQTKLKSGELREKFECSIEEDGVKVPYVTYSGGEKRRISLAVDMALSSIMSESYGSKFNIVCFDEQDFYLDSGGRQGYLELLRELSKDRHVFVVSHDSELKAEFEDVISY